MPENNRVSDSGSGFEYPGSVKLPFLNYLALKSKGKVRPKVTKMLQKRNVN